MPFTGKLLWWLIPVIGSIVVCLTPGVGSRNVILLTRMELTDTPLIPASGSIDPFGPPPMTAINLKANLRQNLTHAFVNVVFTIRSNDGKVENPFYNRTFNVCSFLREPSSSRLLQIIQQELNQHSNIPTSCPIASNTYIIRNASFGNARVPSFLPPTHFRVDINFLHPASKRLMLSTRWYGMLKKV